MSKVDFSQAKIIGEPKVETKASISNEEVAELELRRNHLALIQQDLIIHQREYAAFVDFLIKKYHLDPSKTYALDRNNQLRAID